MKTLKSFLIAGAIFIIFLPIQAKASIVTGTMSTTGNSAADSAAGNKMLTRLYELKAMDRPKMTSSEKRALRKEFRDKKADAY